MADGFQLPGAQAPYAVTEADRAAIAAAMAARSASVTA